MWWNYLNMYFDFTRYLIMWLKRLLHLVVQHFPTAYYKGLHSYFVLSLHPRAPPSLYPGWGCLAWAFCAKRPCLCWSRPTAAVPPLPPTLQDTPSSTAPPTPSTSSYECWPCASPRTGLVESHRDRSKEGKDGQKSGSTSHCFTFVSLKRSPKQALYSTPYTLYTEYF